MTISALIDVLQRVKDESGDMPVKIVDDGVERDIWGLGKREAFKPLFGDPKPVRFVISAEADE